MNQHFLSPLARILKGLDAVQEGDRILLDNPMILFCSSMLTGSHDNTQLPVVLCGGAENDEDLHQPNRNANPAMDKNPCNISGGGLAFFPGPLTLQSKFFYLVDFAGLFIRFTFPVDGECDENHIAQEASCDEKRLAPRHIEKSMKEGSEGKKEEEENQDLAETPEPVHQETTEGELRQEDQDRLWVEVAEVDAGTCGSGLPVRLMTGKGKHQHEKNDQVDKNRARVNHLRTGEDPSPSGTITSAHR